MPLYNFKQELLILGALRVLGRGALFDDCAEMSNLSETTHREFFKEFVEHWSVHKYPNLVQAPTTQAEFERCQAPYKAAGFDGCFASVDCVHIAWDNCPFYLKNVCKGKEGYVIGGLAWWS